MTKEKFLETNGTSAGAAMEDGNWLEQSHLFEVNIDGRAGRADALEDTSDHWDEPKSDLSRTPQAIQTSCAGL